jgi:hypothetical protein
MEHQNETTAPAVMKKPVKHGRSSAEQRQRIEAQNRAATLKRALWPL